MKIGVVAPYKAFGRSAQTIAADLQIQVEVTNGALESGIRAAQDLQARGVDAVLARTPTAALINDSLDIPVIPIEITNFDIIRAFHEARKSGKKIAFIGYKKDNQYSDYDINVVKDILNIEINPYYFSYVTEVAACVRAAREIGADMVVATCYCVVKEAIKQGLQSAMVDTSREDFLAAFNTARTTVEIRQQEIEKARWSKTILENTIEGIITIDSAGIIRVFNNAAERLTGISGRDILGRDIDTACSSHAIFEKIYRHSDDIIAMNKITLSIKRFPIDIDRNLRGLVINLQRVAGAHILDNKAQRNGLVARSTFMDIIGESRVISELKARAARYSNFNSIILICGESGTGKELFAQSIHNSSPISKGPFLAVNCAALPASLLESELFGYEEGAFTGAKKGGKLGLFEMAEGGTLFLDEISEMSLPLQACLLRVLQQKEIIRLGGDRVIPVNTRVICATNRDLQDAIKKGAFREDLYYRMKVLTLLISPLRERREDIPLIARELLKRSNLRLCKSLFMSSDLIDALTYYDWPGNIRELEGFLERLVVLSDGPEVSRETFDDLFEEIAGARSFRGEYGATATDSNGQLYVRLTSLKEMEQQIIQQVFGLLNGDQDELAKVLGISRTTVWRRLKTQQISRRGSAKA